MIVHPSVEAFLAPELRNMCKCRRQIKVPKVISSTSERKTSFVSIWSMVNKCCGFDLWSRALEKELNDRLRSVEVSTETDNTSRSKTTPLTASSRVLERELREIYRYIMYTPS